MHIGEIGTRKRVLSDNLSAGFNFATIFTAPENVKIDMTIST